MASACALAIASRGAGACRREHASRGE